MTGVGVRRRLAAIVLCVGQLMIVLDGTVVNVALPAMQRTLHFSQPDLAWVVNAYLIAFAGFLLLAGRLGDLVGRKRIFTIGLALFTLASLACGFAPTQVTLIGARFIQGVGGAICSSVILGMLVMEFPEARQRAGVIGLYTLVASTGGSLGLLTGGVVTQAVNWHWIFFINVPIGVMTLIGGLVLLEERPGIGMRRQVDVIGALLITGGLMLAVFAIVGAGEYGWTSVRTDGAAIGAIVILAAFIRCEARVVAPLVPLRLLRARDLSTSNVVRCLLVGAATGQFFVGVLLMERVLGYSAVATGAAFVPLTLLLGTVAVAVTPRLVTRIGPKATMLPGILACLVGLVLMARIPQQADYIRDLLPAMLLLGIGQGIGFLPTVAVAMRDSTPHDSGLRSGLVNLSQQMGAALGVAIAASVAASRTAQLAAGGTALPAALLGGYRFSYLVMAGVVSVSLVATAVLMPSRAAHTAVAIADVATSAGTPTMGVARAKIVTEPTAASLAVGAVGADTKARLDHVASRPRAVARRPAADHHPKSRGQRMTSHRQSAATPSTVPPAGPHTVWVIAQPLEAERFAPFGKVVATGGERRPIDLYGGSIDVFRAGPIDADVPVEFLISRSSMRDFRIEFLERHMQLAQSFFPLSGGGCIAAVAAPDAVLTADGLPAWHDIHAFLVGPGCGVTLHRGTWHEPPFPLADNHVRLTTSHAQLTTGLEADLNDAREIAQSDVDKRNIFERTETVVRIALP